MGQHCVDRSHVDDKLNLEHPEILLYGPSADGKPKLLGVEYIIPYRILPPESPAASNLRAGFETRRRAAAMVPARVGMGANASGLFADWNPAVKC